ncbi:hypothetical protein AB0O57_16380 [Streptomyces sp. NPDC091201]|uniref:hypothetical protein n=1 Tax=Streptomyces sp. NPDC091201 TaxID=3155190 RepID=UPI00341A6582
MKHRSAGLLFVAVCGIAPVALGNLLHWSAWLWGFLSVVTASGSLLLMMTVLSGDPASRQPAEAEPPAPPTEQPYQETRVVDAVLPSATDGYDFLFSATVWWQPTPEHPRPSEGASPAVAVSSVVSRALEVVRQEEPGRASFARYRLEGELGIPALDRSRRVKALAADVTLTLSPSDRERLRKLNDLRKDEEIWEYERQHERNKRRYLGDDVLKSAGSAVVWWLARHEDEIERAVDMIGPLARISAAANDTEVPELFRHLLVPPVGTPADVAAGQPSRGRGDGSEEMSDPEQGLGVSDRLRLLLAVAGLKPDMDGHTVFVHRVMRSFQEAGLEEAAEEIRHSFFMGSEEGEAQGVENAGAPQDAGSTEGPWPPRFPDHDDLAPVGTAAHPNSEAGANTFATAATDGPTGEPNGNTVRGWRQAAETDTAAPHLWDPLYTVRRPAASRPWDSTDERGD